MLNNRFVSRLSIPFDLYSEVKSYSIEDDYKDTLKELTSLQVSLIEKEFESLGLCDSKGNALSIRRVQVRIRYADTKDAYSVSILYKLFGASVSVTRFFAIYDDGSFYNLDTRSLVDDCEKGLKDFTYYILDSFIDSIVRDYNSYYLNSKLSSIKPNISPYLVQFDSVEKASDSIVTLSEDLIVWSVVDDFFINLETNPIGKLLKDGKLMALRYIFYSNIQVIDYVFNSDKALFEGYLSVGLGLKVGSSVYTLAKYIGKPLRVEEKQYKRILYKLDGDVISFYRLIKLDNGTRKKLRYYVESLKVDLVTWEILDLSEDSQIYKVDKSSLTPDSTVSRDVLLRDGV